MSDEAVRDDRDARPATPSGAEDPAATIGRDQLEALRNIVMGSRLEQVDEALRARVEQVRASLERLKAQADQADEHVARSLAERIAVVEGLTARLDAAEAQTRQVEAEAQKALAERAAAAEALAERVDAAEALAERVEGEGGLGERIEHVERLTDRVDDIERLAQRVEDIDQLGTRLEVVETVRERVVDEDLRAEDVSSVLPRAVAVRARKDGQLAASLRPTIEDTLEASVRRNPQALVDIIFPVLGPAIRKMIGSAITSMVGTVNRAVESSFTVRGLKWRMQAWRTKRSYAEIALMHGLVYRVEQLFLIQRESGLLLAHALRNPEDAEEPEAVSGMLTAITDFVRDSFNVDSGSEVETFKVGDLTLIVKGGPKAVLAATVRGVPPPELHNALNTTIEQVHRDYGQTIESFDGDMESMAGVEGLLEPNLVEQQKERKKRGSASLIFWVLLSVVLATLVASVVTNRMRAARIERDVRKLARELGALEGVVVTGVHEDEDRWVIAGLRDPLAPETEPALAASPLDEEDVELRLGAYRSLELPFVQKRLASQLVLPDLVRTSWRGRTLVLEGRVMPGWRDVAAKMLATIEGIEAVDVSSLVADPTLTRIRTHQVQLLTTVLPTDTRPDDAVIRQVREVLAKARETAGGLYEVELVIVPLVQRTDDEPAARALATQLVERLKKAGTASTIRFRGPKDLARLRPGEVIPTGPAAEVRFDLAIRLSESGSR